MNQDSTRDKNEMDRIKNAVSILTSLNKPE